jgi:hypothetical protein
LERAQYRKKSGLDPVSRCCFYRFFSVAWAVLPRVGFTATVGSGLAEAYTWLIAVCELHAGRFARSADR